MGMWGLLDSGKWWLRKLQEIQSLISEDVEHSDYTSLLTMHLCVNKGGNAVICSWYFLCREPPRERVIINYECSTLA